MISRLNTDFFLENLFILWMHIYNTYNIYNLNPKSIECIFYKIFVSSHIINIVIHLRTEYTARFNIIQDLYFLIARY